MFQGHGLYADAGEVPQRVQSRQADQAQSKPGQIVRNLSSRPRSQESCKLKNTAEKTLKLRILPRSALDIWEHNRTSSHGRSVLEPVPSSRRGLSCAAE